MRKALFLIIFIIIFSACGSPERYKDELREVSDLMMDNARHAEQLISQYSNVWRFSIESKGPISVPTMMIKTGINEEDIVSHFSINDDNEISNDFSTNIHSLISYYKSTGDIDKLEETSEEIKDRVKELNNAPGDLEKALDEVLELYELTERYVDMAINPTGSLQEFNKNANELSSDIVSKYKQIEITVP